MLDSFWVSRLQYKGPIEFVQKFNPICHIFKMSKRSSVSIPLFTIVALSMADVLWLRWQKNEIKKFNYKMKYNARMTYNRKCISHRNLK